MPLAPGTRLGPKRSAESPASEIQATQAAIELDPLSTRSYRALAHCYWRMGRLAEAEAACARAVEIQPEAPVARVVLGCVILDQGRAEEALAVFRAEPDSTFRAVGEALALYTLGRKGESDAALATVIENTSDYAAVQIAYVHAFRGENDEAFEWLERARVSRDTGLHDVPGMPLVRKLHGDPCWREFLERIGFTDSEVR